MTTPEERAKYEAVIARAKSVATTLALNQVGDVNAMASAATMEVLDELRQNEALLMTTLRVLAGTVTALGMNRVAVDIPRGTAQFEQATADMIRGTIGRLEYVAY